jgi:hypothetical protein
MCGIDPDLVVKPAATPENNRHRRNGDDDYVRTYSQAASFSTKAADPPPSFLMSQPIPIEFARTKVMSKTRIIEAARKLDLESIKKLLDDNPSLLSVTDRMRRNLLHLACSAQCKELNVPKTPSVEVLQSPLEIRPRV